MKRKITFLGILFLLFGSIGIRAQDSIDNYMNRVNYIFANVDHNKVSTGLLSDFGIQTVPPEYYDGAVRDSNEVDISTWKALYAGMYSSRFNSLSTLPVQDDVFNSINQNLPAAGQAVPFAVMCINYNRLRDDAYTSGLVQVQNDQIFDIPGYNPYETKTLFAATPIITYITGTSSTIQFVLKSSLYFNNGKTITSMSIDLGDGNGFHNISWDAPFSGNYSTTGIKSFTLNFSFSDGTVLNAHGKYSVDYPSSLKSGNAYYTVSSLVKVFNATQNHSGGTVNVAFGNGHTDGIIRQPLIVAEGFDAWKILQISNTTINDFLYNFPWQPFGTIQVPLTSGGNLDGYLYNKGYDIIYVDYNDGTDDIRRNAALLEDVIDWVNSQKQGGKSNTVMGISMGGLVACYALRQMEQQGRDHQTEMYISIDSPHNGANVPVGVQAAICHAQNLNFSVGIPGLIMVQAYSPVKHMDELKQAVALLNSPAAKQMLIYRVEPTITGSLWYNNTYYQSFMTEYHSMGLPQRCYNVAVSDGSGIGTRYFDPHAELVNYSGSYSLNWWQEMLSELGAAGSILTNLPQLVVNIIPGKTEIKGESVINAIPSTPDRVYHGRIYVHKKLLWFINVNSNITNVNFNSTSGMLPLDGAPGGSYDVNQFLSSNVLPAGSLKQTQFCFIPAASALGLNNWQNYVTSGTNTYTSLNNYDFIAIGQSPFQSYYHPMPSYNSFHTQFDAPADFLKSMFDNIGTINNCNRSIQNVTYTSSQTITGCNISVQNVSIQNNSSIILDANGNVTINGPFTVQLGSALTVK